MKKTVKLMISISNKSNLITTNTNLILNEIMRCLRQPPTLISWRATIIQPIPTQIDITIIIIDIKMPHRVHKVTIMFQFLWFIDFEFPVVIICPYSRFIIAMSFSKGWKVINGYCFEPLQSNLLDVDLIVVLCLIQGQIFVSTAVDKNLSPSQNNSG